MAVTSIWRVNGWLGKVVVYVENPDKTTSPEFYENGDMTERECQGLDDVSAYAVNSRKTEQHKEDSDVLETLLYLDIFLLAFFYRRMDSESSLKCFASCSYSFVLLS